MASLQLRAWQTAALTKFLASTGSDFLAVATPGAGKTTFALTAAAALLATEQVKQVVVVAPTEHLKRQWADAASKFNLSLDPTWTNTSSLAPQYHGVVVTYAQVASDPHRHHAGVSYQPTFVILDEIHHAGDSLTWGDAVKYAYAPATRRLSLSGSPWRSDTNPIPFVDYTPDADGARRSAADYTYGYGPALADGVVRPVLFMAYAGRARWRDSAGVELEAALDDPLDKPTAARALRTALDPAGDWIRRVFTAADERLSQVRAAGQPDAGGLVLASNQTHARAYAKVLAGICDEPVTTVLSDEADASAKIEKFAAGTQRWMVAVRMVSEGVDVPRLAVGVYGTNYTSALFFTQAVGRFVRARKSGETATLFVPSVPVLLGLAASLEAERDHVLDRTTAGDGAGLDDEALERANRTERTVDPDAQTFTALEATAHLDRVILDGNEFGAPAEVGSSAERDMLSIPGMLPLEDIRRLLEEQTRRAMAAVGASDGQSDAIGDSSVPLHRRTSGARRELSRLVRQYCARTNATHAEVHVRLRQACGGPPVGQATLEQLQHRITTISTHV